MNWVRQLVAATAGACLAAGLGSAQILGREAAPPKMVEFSLIATDAKGQPVADLKGDDLQIVDSGRPQQVALFRQVGSTLKQQASVRPGEFSNRSEFNVPRATLVLFDMLNESFALRGTALTNLIRGLQGLESGEFVYVYLLTQDAKLYPVRGLPGSGPEVPNSANEPWTKNAKPLLEGAVGKVFGLRHLEIDIDTRVRLTYGALGAVAGMLSGIPGRKDVVWITHGVPISLGPNVTDGMQSVDYTPLLRELSQRFDRSNVAIYPVQQDPPGMAMQGEPEARYSGMGSQDTLQQFADLTGGPTTTSSDIGDRIRHAINDVRSSYLVGFFPPVESWDGKFHKLKITSKRKGIRIQAKTGYYAWIDQPNDVDQALESGMKTSFDTAEIEVRATASLTTGPTVVHLSFRINPADVLIAQEGDRYSAHLVLQMVGYYSNGSAQRTAVTPLDLDMTAAKHQEVLRDWIEFQQNITLEEPVEKIRVLAYDRGSHALGSLTIPVRLIQR